MNKLIAALLLFLSIFVIGEISAQKSKVDSLENVLKIHQIDDTVKVRLFNEIVNTVYKTDADKALKYAVKAVDLSDKLNFGRGKYESFYLMGLLSAYNKSDKLALEYYLKALKSSEDISYQIGIGKSLLACGIRYAAVGNIAEATECYKRARKIAEELHDLSLATRSMANLCIIYTGKGDYVKALEGYREVLGILEKKDDKKVRSTVFINMGEISKYQGNYPQAIEFYQKALKIQEEANDEQGISLSFVNIGSIYTLQGGYEKALEYEHRALKIAEKINDKRVISNCYEEIGIVYLQTNNPEALIYFQKALKIVEELSYQTPILRIVSKIGDYYRARGDYNEALAYYARALKISEELSRKRTICETGIKIGGIYLLTKDYAKALKSSQKSLELAVEIKLLDNQKDIHKQFSEIYAATSDYRNAYLHYKLFTQLNDSVYNEKNVRKTAELEYTYKFEKEKQALELEQQKKDAVQVAEKKLQRIIILSLSAAFFLMCLLAVFLVRSYWFKNRTNILLTKQKHDIEELNEEYQVINEELKFTNEQLVVTKNLVEEREDLLIQITDNVPVFIALVDKELKYLFANSGYAEIFNQEKPNIPGKLVREVLNCDSYERAQPYIVDVLKGQTVTFENLVQLSDGRLRIIQTTYQPYYLSNRIHGFLVCSADITERKHAEQALKEVEVQKAKILADEIERINKELESNQKAITAASLKLIQNSERDAQTIDRLEEIEINTDKVGKLKINTLISDYKRISYNSNWDEFEILFEKVHSSFYEKLNTQFPTLTTNERKICAFLKLNMSNKEIAQITFQSDEALKKARLRLRQKLDLGRETNLVTFLQNF